MTDPEPTPPPPVPYVPGPAELPELQPLSAPQPPPARSAVKPLVFAAVGLVAGLAIGAGVASAVAGGAAAPAAAAPTPGVSTAYVTITVAAPTTASTTSPPAAATTSPAAPPPPPPTSITDGTWTVGEDVPAGTYKATAAPDNCYWAIYKSGQNQDLGSIINNHNGGGNLRVTLKAGQDFETDRCGMWLKV